MIPPPSRKRARSSHAVPSPACRPYDRFAPFATRCMRGSAPPLTAMSRHMQCSKRHLSFDRFVGTSDEGWRHFEAKRLGGLEIDHELELGRSPDGKFPRASRPCGCDRHTVPRAQNYQTAREVTSARWAIRKLSGMTTRPPFGRPASGAMTDSISDLSRTGAEVASTAKLVPAALKRFR
jgi:hypothetical protein